MKLYANKLTYHNCPVELREQLMLTSHQRHTLLKQMHTVEPIHEAAILQTCNRLEFYVYAAKNFDIRSYLAELIKQTKPAGLPTWQKFSTCLENDSAVKHLFNVAAGLDSQMLGENQILAQVKNTYTESLRARMSKLVFHKLFHQAFRAGKAVRTQTDINCGAVSVALAAVELARDRDNLPNSTAMITGAGENAELVARYLQKSGLKNLIIANRDPENAQKLAARLNSPQTIGLTDIIAHIDQTDIIIGSTASDHPILTADQLKPHLAGRRKKLLLIDLAVPRDFDPALKDLPQVELHNIDDLNHQTNANREKRSRYLPQAQKIVETFTRDLLTWYATLDLVPVIAELTGKGLELARAEADRYAADFGPENAEKLRLFAESLVKKMLHGPISYVKNGNGDELSPEKLEAVDLINRMFLSRGQHS